MTEPQEYTLADVVQEFFEDVPPSGRAAIRSRLDVLARHFSGGTQDADGFNWLSLRESDVEAARDALGERYAASTVNKAISALRKLLYLAMQRGLYAMEDYAAVKSVPGFVTTFKRKRRPRKTVAEVPEAEPEPELIPVPAPQVAAAQKARDAAILALYCEGHMPPQLAAFNLEHYDTDGKILVRGEWQPLPPVVKRAVNEWLRYRGTREGPLFVPCAPWQRLSLDTVRTAVRQ